MRLPSIVLLLSLYACDAQPTPAIGGASAALTLEDVGDLVRGSEGDQVGADIALVGDTAFVSGSGQGLLSDRVRRQASAMIFFFNGTTWSQVFQDQKPWGIGFGTDLAVCSDVALAGAPEDDTAASDSGSAHLYELVTGTWTARGPQYAPDASASARFGAGVACGAQDLFVGAPGVHKVYRLKRAGGSWMFDPVTLSAWDSPSDPGNFGHVLAVHEDKLLVGNGAQRTAYVFTWDGAAWQGSDKLLVGGRFTTMDFDGSTAVFGTPSDDTVYIWTLRGGVWVSLPALTPPQSSLFGACVAVRDGVMVIGAPNNGTYSAGSASFYELVGGAWSLDHVSQLFQGSGWADRYGSACAVDDKHLAIGAPWSGKDGSTDPKGRVLAWRLDRCPDDASKFVPGDCGCGTPDLDRDGDGTSDCLDQCSDDPGKITAGACGCGSPEADTDADGTPDCVDGCPQDPMSVKAPCHKAGGPEGTKSSGGGCAIALVHSHALVNPLCFVYALACYALLIAIVRRRRSSR